MRRKRTTFISIAIAAAALLALAVSVGYPAPKEFVSASPLLQVNTPTTCRGRDRSWIELSVQTTSQSGFESGRVLSANDGILAVIVIMSDVDANDAVIKLDYAASLRVNAILIVSGDRHDLREFDPPVRSGSGISAGEGNSIDSISFCYRVSIPAPPKATTAEPRVQPEVPTAEPAATELTFDVSGLKTAEARAIEIAATATVAANQAAVDLAAAQRHAAEIAATATAAVEAAAKRDAALLATVAAQASEIAAVEAKANDARATAESLQATLAAPTETPIATETLEPTPSPKPKQYVTTVVYATSGATPFADWQPVKGWDLNREVAKTDGSADQSWLVAPVPSGLSVDVIVEIEFRVVGGEVCPRNFGLEIRGSATGYYAAAIEWACDPGLVLWAGNQVVETPGTPALPDPGDGWHTLRISAIGDQISVMVDGIVIIDIQNDLYPTGNLVAFWTDGVGLEIRRITVSEVQS